jgi:energy-converting hydrogenase Eha subunit C
MAADKASKKGRLVVEGICVPYLAVCAYIVNAACSAFNTIVLLFAQLLYFTELEHVRNS